MPFKRPTLIELDERIRNDIAGRMRIGNVARTASLIRRSTVRVLARVYAGACHLLYGALEWLAKQRFVHSMEAEFLDAEGLTYDIERKGSDFARGPVAVRGIDGAAVLPMTLCRRDDGMQYQVIDAPPIAGGVAEITVRAVNPGKDGNALGGTKLRFMSGVDGVNSELVVSEDGLRGGVDAERDEDYRDRILDRKREPPHGGAKHDYEAWAKEIVGVTRAWCLPLWMGDGTVGVMFVCDDDIDIFPNDDQCAEIKSHIEAVRPVTAEVFVFPPMRREIDVIVKISPDTEDTRDAVRAEIADFLIREGAPESIIRVSRLSEAISTAIGEHHHYLIDPVNDMVIAKNEVPVMGEVVFIDNPAGTV